MRGQGQAGVEIYIESNEHVKKLKYVIVPSRIRFTSESHPLKQAVLKLSLCKVENFFPIVFHSLYPFSLEEGMHFITILWRRRGGLKDIFWRRGLMGKGESIFGGGFRVSRDSNYKFYIKTLIWLTIYVQTERFCITCYFSLTLLASSVLLKVFLTVLYFTNSLFKGVKCIKIEY